MRRVAALRTIYERDHVCVDGESIVHPNVNSHYSMIRQRFPDEVETLSRRRDQFDGLPQANPAIPKRIIAFDDFVTCDSWP